MHTYSTSSHSFSSLSSIGPANSAFSQPRSIHHQPATAVTAASVSVEDGSSQASSLDANQSGESIGDSSFGEEPGTSSSNTATPLTIGQQKATAILPEVHLITGESLSAYACYICMYLNNSALLALKPTKCWVSNNNLYKFLVVLINTTRFPLAFTGISKPALCCCSLSSLSSTQMHLQRSVCT